jgi:hypothetical protein
MRDRDNGDQSETIVDNRRAAPVNKRVKRRSLSMRVNEPRTQ